MSTPRFFVEGLDGPRLALSAQDSRHALRALRLRPGAEIQLSDGAGTVGRGRLAGQEGGRAVVDVEDRSSVLRPEPSVAVLMAPPSSDRLRWAVQKLGEIGVDSMAPLVTERQVRRWPAHGKHDDGDARLAGLRSVARESAMQSRQAFLMRVDPPRSLADALDAGAERQLAIAVLWERGGRPLSDTLPEGMSAVRLVIGPEGGFSPSEVELVEASGVPLATLGRSILRTETAAIVSAALALARYGRLG